MGWSRSLLTDSGGYQVYSLASSRKITEEGVHFRSHIDGSHRFLSPEIAIDLQRTIGADICMSFDECTPYPATFKETQPIYGKNTPLVRKMRPPNSNKPILYMKRKICSFQLYRGECIQN